MATPRDHRRSFSAHQRCSIEIAASVLPKGERCGRQIVAPMMRGQGGAPCLDYRIIQTDIFRLETAVTISKTILGTYLSLWLPGMAGFWMIRRSDSASEK
jgi:hypothetical protein